MSEQILLVVTNTATFINGTLSSDVYQEMKKELGYLPEDAVFRVRQLQNIPGNSWAKNWDGRVSVLCHSRKHCKCTIKKEGTHFPTGLISRAISILKKNFISYAIHDKRPLVEHDLGVCIDTSEMEERDYQQRIIKDGVKANRGIVKMATGSGKTSVAAGLIAQANVKPFIFYVTSKDLMSQAVNELSRFLLKDGKKAKIGIIGDGKCEIEDINVMTIQTAVRSCGLKYKKNDEDEEGVTTKERLLSAKKREEIKKLIVNAKGIIIDECLTGDSIIYTEHGYTRIDDVEKKKCTKVLSYDNGIITWCNIDGFIQQGKRDIIEIKLESGRTLKCTKNHPLMTQMGWKKAGEITHKDMILGLANVVAERDCTVEDKDMFLDIKLKKENYQNGKIFTKKSEKTHRYANVVVGEGSILSVQYLKHLSVEEVTENITSFVTDTIKDLKNGIFILLRKKKKQYLGRCLGIIASVFPQKEAKTPGYTGITDCAKKHGLFINPKFYNASHHVWQNARTTDMGNVQSGSILGAFLAFVKFTILHILMAKKQSLESGLTKLVKSVWHGGFATTGVIRQNCRSIQRDIPWRKTILSQDGFQTDMETLKSDRQKDTITLESPRQQEKKSLNLLEGMCQNVCHTKYDRVISIKDHGQDYVYDIEVNRTHCFFANGLLVHNCQHVRSESCQMISDLSVSCRYKWGMSATPWRDHGDDILIDACFGRPICNINASFLISHPKKYLIKPTIYFIPIKNMRGRKFDTYDEAYNTAIVENILRNDVISKTASKMADSGRVVLVLCKHIAHGNALESIIPGSLFLHGSHSAKQRKEHLDKMRSREACITIASTIFDEGVDVRPLDTLILAGSGMSQTRALQRVGRILRPYPGKQDAVVIDFEDHCKYMLAHANKRRRIYATEPEFIIEDLAMDIQ
jgi:superfamily II DNA or RNA helicase